MRNIKRGGYIHQAWLVLLLAIVFGVALATVQVFWGPIIEKNKRNDALSQIPSLVPGAVADLTPPAESYTIGVNTYAVYRAMAEGDRQIGWVVQAKGPGYADNIELLIGLSVDTRRMTGMYVLSQNETPGLGNKIVTPAFRANFVKSDLDQPLEVTREKGIANSNNALVQAITGATISSDSVTNIVNRTVAEFRSDILPQIRASQQ